MAVGYRAVLRLDERLDAVAVAEEQVRAWLQEKRRGRGRPIEWEGPGHYRFSRNLELVVVQADHDEKTPRRLYRVVDRNPGGHWIVSLYAAALPTSHARKQTIVVEVELVGATREEALEKIAAPNIVVSLLNTYGATDGAISLTGSPAIIRSAEIDDVVEAITDQSRMASVVVALSPMRDLDDGWRQAVTSLVRESVGVTAAYVVYADAAEELNAALPPSHQVAAGFVRTYLPRVDVSDPTDGTRHKWLTLRTFTQSLDGKRVAKALQRRHGSVARRRFVEAELPSDVQRMIDVLRRAETGVERAARVEERIALTRRQRTPNTEFVALSEPTATPVLTTPWVERIGLTIKRWLKIDARDITEIDQLDGFIEAQVAEVAIAAEQLAEAADELEELRAEIATLRRQREDMELDWAEAQESGQDLERENAVLRQRLAASANAADAYVEPVSDDWRPPASVEELVHRLTPGHPDAHEAAMRRVVFTGVEEGALEIDRRYQSGVYANAFWRYVQVLHDYAEAQTAGLIAGGVHVYLNAGEVKGEKCPTKQHASKESDTTLANKRWRAERIFPVPEYVDERGEVLMQAHFKPTWHDTFAPRMHYYDDVAKSGKVYIGYIGRHLTNSQS